MIGEGVFCFAGHKLDLQRGALLAGDREIHLRPKSLELLTYLVKRPGQLVSKDELIQALWPDVAVTDESLTRCISDIRQALNDGEQRIIKTALRRGYLFNTPVTLDLPGAPTTAPPPIGNPLDAAPKDMLPRLSIVVLPFVNLGGDPAQEYFVDAITESLTTDISRVPRAFVIARGTAFTYKAKTVDARQVGRELGVRYVLEGSVQPGQNRVRVNAQLIEAQTGAHLWAERFDKPRVDAFDMQDEITARLARMVGIEMVVAEGQRAQRERPNNLDAMDLTLRGWAMLYRHVSLEDLQEARALFKAALGLDALNVDALVGIARAHAQEIAAIYPDAASEQARAAETAVAAALRLAPDNAEAHLCRAIVFQVSSEPEAALRECELAISIDPNHAQAHARAGLLKIYVGRAEEAEAHVAAAIRLSPRDPELRLWQYFIGSANLHLGKLSEAVDHLRRSIQMNASFPLPHFLLASALALMGRDKEAREAFAEGQRVGPTFTIRNFVDQRRGTAPTFVAQRHRVVEGMRRAGVPE